MTADASHFTRPRSARTPEPGQDLKSAPMPKLEEELGYSPDGLSSAEATRRLAQYGPALGVAPSHVPTPLQAVS
jgi:H+-transporting ATPase